jgi:hypothetical protein
MRTCRVDLSGTEGVVASRFRLGSCHCYTKLIVVGCFVIIQHDNYRFCQPTTVIDQEIIAYFHRLPHGQGWQQESVEVKAKKLIVKR